MWAEEDLRDRVRPSGGRGREGLGWLLERVSMKDLQKVFTGK